MVHVFNRTFPYSLKLAQMVLYIYTDWHLIQLHLKPPTSCRLSGGPTSAWSSRRLLLFTEAKEALVHRGAPFCPFFPNPLLISRIIPYQHVRVPSSLHNAPSASICIGFRPFFLHSIIQWSTNAICRRNITPLSHSASVGFLARTKLVTRNWTWSWFALALLLTSFLAYRCLQYLKCSFD